MAEVCVVSTYNNSFYEGGFSYEMEVWCKLSASQYSWDEYIIFSPSFLFILGSSVILPCFIYACNHFDVVCVSLICVLFPLFFLKFWTDMFSYGDDSSKAYRHCSLCPCGRPCGYQFSQDH